MAEETKSSKRFVGGIKQVEEVEVKAQEAQMKVNEVKTLVTMLEIARAYADPSDEVDEDAVFGLMKRCTDQAIAEIDQIERITAGLLRGSNITKRGC